MTQPPKIAIVEDEYIVALDIRNFLEKNGYKAVGIFPSGEELISKMKETSPDLVLMDIHIRGKFDGVETSQIIHEQWRTPVILLTAYADDETIARAKITQPFGYILKPFEERELRTAIEIALYRSGMERRLRESEERFHRLFDEGITGNFLSDSEGNLLEANPAFRRLFGIEPDALLPSLPDLFHDMAAWESFRTALWHGKRIELAELAMKGRGKGELLILANAVLVLDSDGNAVGIQGELSDLTEKRLLEERLGQSQKMEAIGRLAGGIAHDFNNILTAVIGYANLLAEETAKYPELLEDVDGIRKSAGKAAALTRQLLTFSRRQVVCPSPIGLNTLVTDITRMLRRLLTEDIVFSIYLGEGIPDIFADPTQVEQVLVNLVVNAKDAMPEGGQLLLSTRIEKIANPRLVGLDMLAAGDYAVLSVRDTGHGISQEMFTKIFEPFFTTKPRERGTGLGLSTVYGIVKQTGGAIGVESKPGEGAMFTVFFPAMQGSSHDDSKEKSAETDSRISPATRLGTILVVDDDDEVRVLAERYLRRRGHRVLAAANSGEAILLAESLGHPLDLLITDIVMPIMDGYRLARRLRAINPDLRVIYVSGYPDRALDVETAGCFLPKPYSEADLLTAADAIFAELPVDHSSQFD